MAAFLSQTELSRGGLKLYLSNDLGQAQDAASVRWTVFSADGRRVSGRNLPATKATVGEYYAPWFSDVVGGGYRIDWEIQETACGPCRTVTNHFFVMDPALYGPCGLSESVSLGAGTFMCGSQLGPGDLAVYLTGADGLPADAYAVFWTVVDKSGRPVTPRTAASFAATGHYFASWQSSVPSGDYTIQWEFQQDADSPLQQTSQGFYVLSSNAPTFAALIDLACYAPNPQSCTEVIRIVDSTCMGSSPCGTFLEVAPSCGCASTANCTPCPPSTIVSPTMPNPSSSCCAFDMPRVVHLATQTLPASGAFTSQPQYQIPTGVRKITFYITYSRGAPGGRAAFKLFWGNGTEEIQETIFDTDLENVDEPSAVQNLYLQTLDGPTPDDGAPVTFGIYVNIPGGSNRVRLLAAEKGVPGTPGSIGITITASST